MLCPVCNINELIGKQKYCSGSCRVKYSRQKDNVTLPATVTLTAKLLPVDTKLPFSGQQAQALTLDQRAVHNSRNGKDEWVVPGKCKWGVCLNPNCRFHKEVVDA